MDTHDDAKFPGAGVRDEAELSRIDSITIARKILGTPRSVSAADSFGSEAEEIGALKADGITYKLTAPAHADVGNFIGTGDVGHREL